MSGLFGQVEQHHNELANKFGAYNASVGIAGENYYDRVLERAGIKEDFEVIRSLSIPSALGQTKVKTDVDLVIVNDNHVLPIDVKKWIADKPYWTLFPEGLLPMRGALPLVQKGEWKRRLSRNMQMAHERYQEAFPNAIIEKPIVVFVPHNSKDRHSVPPSVSLLRFPGGIKSYTSGASISVIRELWPVVFSRDEDLIRSLNALKKR